MLKGLPLPLALEGLIGRPDLFLPKRRFVVFVHGCFWYQREGCCYTTIPANPAEFCQAKFVANVARNRTVRGALLAVGWRMAAIWNCSLRKPEQVTEAADCLSAWLLPKTDNLELGEREV